MSAVMDKTVLMPVYDTYSGNGSNASYNITGFISLKLCGYDKTEKGACYDSSVPMTGDDMQVRFVSFSPISGDISTVCGIAQACAYDNYVIGLVR